MDATRASFRATKLLRVCNILEGAGLSVSHFAKRNYKIGNWFPPHKIYGYYGVRMQGWGICIEEDEGEYRGYNQQIVWF